ncbi:unnamed protein product [Gordionus sp. m RMFG-2023]
MSAEVNVAHVREKARLWRNVFFYVFCPLTILTHIHVYIAKKKTHGHRPPYKEYSYMRKISKPFFWKDGKTPLFYNPYYNPLPGVGYVTDEPPNH